MSSDEWFRRRRRFPFDISAFPSRFFNRDFDEIMEEMERRINEAFQEIGERIPEGLVKQRRLLDGSTVKEMGPFVYGYSVTIGPDKKPVIREFGNIKASPAKPGLDLKDVREPLVDVFCSNGDVRVIAEIPGVGKQNIKLHATENTLTISVYTPERKYHKDIDLPSEVDPGKAKTAYNNGVLEVTLPKVKEKKPKGVPIKLE